MLRMTRKFNYAMLILTSLRDGKSVCAREIADRFALSPSLTANVLKELAAVGILESTRGKHGGYRLILDPKDIALLTIVEAIEGPMAITNCTSDEPDCVRQNICPCGPLISRINAEIGAIFDKYSLADVFQPWRFATLPAGHGAESGDTLGEQDVIAATSQTNREEGDTP